MVVKLKMLAMSQKCDYNMKLWTLKSFVLSDGVTKLVEQWLAEQDVSVQLAFITRLRYLQGLPANGWDRPYVGQLRRECKGLFEIVLKVNKVQYRPIGYFSGRMEFTILAFAIEKGSKFEPLNVCEQAFNRKALIEENEERASEFTI